MASLTPSFEQVVARLSAIQALRLSTTVYRSATPEYAKEGDLLTGEGSRLHGSRWNPSGVAAIYASLSPETAMEESLAHYRFYSIPIRTAMPRMFVAIKVQLTSVLDLTVGVNRRRLQIAESRLLQSDWRSEMALGKEALPQLVGRAAKEAGFEAILVRSAADKKGINLIVFPDNLHKTNTLVVLNAGKLSSGD